MRRSLSEAQIGQLLVRLAEMKVKPGLIVTAFWHAGWVVPPILLMPFFDLVLIYLPVISAVLYLLMLFLLGNVLAPLDPLRVVIPCLPGILSLLNSFGVARRRYQAWLVAAVAVVLLGGLILILGPHAAQIDWRLSKAGGLFGSPFLTFIFFALLLIITTRALKNWRNGRQSWRRLVDETLVVDAF